MVGMHEKPTCSTGIIKILLKCHKQTSVFQINKFIANNYDENDFDNNNSQD